LVSPLSDQGSGPATDDQRAQSDETQAAILSQLTPLLHADHSETQSHDAKSDADDSQRSGEYDYDLRVLKARKKTPDCPG